MRPSAIIVLCLTLLTLGFFGGGGFHGGGKQIAFGCRAGSPDPLCRSDGARTIAPAPGAGTATAAGRP